MAVKASAEKKKMIYNLVEETFQKAYDIYGVVTPEYEVKFNMYSKRTAGRAGYTSGRLTGNYKGIFLKFNPVFFENIPWSQYRETVIHEVAHLVELLINGNISHSKTFKAIDRKLGGRGTRCHSYKLPDHLKKERKPREKVAIYCKCRKHMIGKVKLRNMKRNGLDMYHCKSCKGGLSLYPVEKIPAKYYKEAAHG